jgi:hypothetical protein
MEIALLDTPQFVMGLRIVTLFVCMLLIYCNAKAVKHRWKAGLLDFSDLTISLVIVYWTIYSGYAVIQFGGETIPPLGLFLFNMRFGLFLTLVAICSLIKDRMLLTELFESALRFEEIEEMREVNDNELVS